ncbi:hypothetical protein SELMODRAFT_71865, partial [Selaginella moellendorffii]
TSMLSAYALSGHLDEAKVVFDRMPDRDVVTWTAMVSAYAQAGHISEALRIFDESPEFTILNPAAFSKILAGCSHAGLVSESLSYFSSMGENYEMVASKEHYCSLVDALGRSGKLGEARDLIDNMPFIADVVVCGSLLASCERSSNLNVGRDIAKNILSIDPRNGSSCVALANTIA